MLKVNPDVKHRKGRPVKYGEEVKDLIVSKWNEGMDARDIAEEVGCCKKTVYLVLKERSE